MDAALMLAQIFGPFLAIKGLWMLLYGDNLVKIMHSIKGSPAAFYISTCFYLLLGVFFINTFNMWMMNAAFAVTLLGWMFFLRGALGLFLPQIIVKACMTKTSWIKIMGIIPFVWGLILIWFAYYM